MQLDNIIKILKTGGVGVMPTDTIYGLLGSALNEKTVERIYRVRQRQPDKPLIILVSSLADLKLFGVKLDKNTVDILDKYWPGKISVILLCSLKKFDYLHRGTKNLAFRLPKNKWLQDLLKKTGPLVAPSANPEGLSPAKNVTEAKKYFGEQVDFYQVGKISSSQSSTLIEIANGKIKVLREGAVKVS
jgi:L-threonylcarbamoyladenylate synthase